MTSAYGSSLVLFCIAPPSAPSLPHPVAAHHFPRRRCAGPARPGSSASASRRERDPSRSGVVAVAPALTQCCRCVPAATRARISFQIGAWHAPPVRRRALAAPRRAHSEFQAGGTGLNLRVGRPYPKGVCVRRATSPLARASSAARARGRWAQFCRGVRRRARGGPPLRCPGWRGSRGGSGARESRRGPFNGGLA